MSIETFSDPRQSSDWHFAHYFLRLPMPIAHLLRHLECRELSYPELRGLYQRQNEASVRLLVTHPKWSQCDVLRRTSACRVGRWSCCKPVASDTPVNRASRYRDGERRFAGVEDRTGQLRCRGAGVESQRRRINRILPIGRSFELIVGCERLLTVTSEHLRGTRNVKCVVKRAAVNGDRVIRARL